MAMTPRQMLMIVAGVAVVGAAAIFYFVNSAETTTLPQATAATAAPATSGQDSELMTPGPLGERTMGDPKAPNTVIEYASLTCPHCQRFHEEVFTAFKEKYIDTGKVYFIFREFSRDPLDTSAFMLARCAPADRYFPIVDLLFDQQQNWAFVQDPVTALQNLVKQAGYSQDSFKACLTNQQILDGVNAVRDRATSKFGVDSTPTFFFNGEKKLGEQTLEDIGKILGS